ncbi:MAG: hypothetical protein WEB52_00490 [Dehalococcoidia bacterium]
MALIAMAALGARCVENTSVRVDADGYTHIYGEIYNDTEIQGHSMRIHGRLLRSDGSVIAEQDAPLCPPELPPHSQTFFDICFDSPNLPPSASFDVRMVGGTASDAGLPDPRIRLLGTSASFSQGRATLRMDIRNESGVEYFNLNACIAGYDAAGKVIAANSNPLQNYNDQGTPIPGGLGSAPDYVLMHLDDAPADLRTVRGWFWIAQDPTNTRGTYRPLMTGLVVVPR